MHTAASNKKATTVTLPTDEQILITREFNAPRHLVYRAWTTPELVERWWHANRGKVTQVAIDLRVGGNWRYVMITDGGVEVGFHGQYHEIVPSERLVTTEVYEGLPDGVTEQQAGTINTATFTEADGHTILTLLIQATSKTARDAIIDSGMESGVRDAMNLLEEVSLSIA
ncbi:MAG TPA: SRPBCC family protein [Solirubrobacteraceae bacterium]